MATVLPPEFPADHSRAEHLIYRKLRDETPTDWYALHSVGLVGHDRKAWAEIDFVVITDRAVICIEVKGGRITVEGNRWYTSGRKLSHSPFEQAGGAAGALWSYLKKELETDLPAVGWGVCFPNTEFAQRAPWVHPDLLFDERDRALPLHVFLDRVSGHWLEHFRRRGETTEQLDTQGRERLLELLAPDFDLVSTLRARVRGIRDDLVRLTEEQSEFLAGFEDEPRLILRGGAGSGKTMLALAETERLARNGDSVLLLCASGRLASELAKAFRGAEHIRVASAVELAATAVAKADVGAEIPNAAPADFLAIHLPDLAARHLPPDQVGAWDALVIDEAQDLMSPNWARFFDRLLRGGLEEGRWRFFLDPNQDVLLGSDPTSIDHIDRKATSHYRLRKNCRNTRQVATSAALLTGLGSLDTLRVEGPDVGVHWYRDASGGRATAISVVRDWLKGSLTPDQIAVLSHRPLRESILAGAQEAEIGAPLVDAMGADPDDPTAIRYWSISDFKGLEADAVLLVDVDDLGPGQRRLELYLAVTRARALLCIMLDRRVEEQYSALAADFGERTRLGVFAAR